MALHLSMKDGELYADGVDLKRAARQLLQRAKAGGLAVHNLPDALDVVARTLGFQDYRAARQTAANAQSPLEAGGLTVQQMCAIHALTAGFVSESTIAAPIEAYLDGDDDDFDDENDVARHTEGWANILNIKLGEDGRIWSQHTWSGVDSLVMHHSHDGARFTVPLLLPDYVSHYMCSEEFVMKLAAAYCACLSAALRRYGINGELPYTHGAFKPAQLVAFSGRRIAALPAEGIVLPDHLMATERERAIPDLWDK